jgi:uncharacterized Zn finger protein
MVKRSKAQCPQCQEMSECEVLSEVSVRSESTSLTAVTDPNARQSKSTFRCPKCGSIFTRR